MGVLTLSCAPQALGIAANKGKPMIPSQETFDAGEGKEVRAPAAVQPWRRPGHTD